MLRKQKQILIATSNKGKFAEIMEVLGQLPYEILSLQDAGIRSFYEEDGATFEENALGKARHYARLTNLLTIAEDSGIVVDALKDELGIKTRRWGAGANASDEEWIQYFLEKMNKIHEANRGAKFVCCAAILDEKGQEAVFNGETYGSITKQLEAPLYPGLPLSSCFKPADFDKVYAALTKAEKNKISHRGKAMWQVYDYLSGGKLWFSPDREKAIKCR